MSEPTATCPTCHRDSVLTDCCYLCNPPVFNSDQHRDKWLAMQRWYWPDYVPPWPEAEGEKVQTELFA